MNTIFVAQPTGVCSLEGNTFYHELLSGNNGVKYTNSVALYVHKYVKYKYLIDITFLAIYSLLGFKVYFKTE